jgi:hypothetical protein
MPHDTRKRPGGRPGPRTVSGISGARIARRQALLLWDSPEHGTQPCHNRLGNLHCAARVQFRTHQIAKVRSHYCIYNFLHQMKI